MKEYAGYDPGLAIMLLDRTERQMISKEWVPLSSSHGSGILASQPDSGALDSASNSQTRVNPSEYQKLNPPKLWN